MNELPPKTSLVARTTTPSLTVEAGRLGPPGIRGELNILAQVPGDNRSDGERFSDRSERPFVVEALISKQPPTMDRIAGDFTEQDGSSYFNSPPPTGTHRIDTGAGRFELRKNANHEISFVRYECLTTDAHAAHRAFLNAVLPVLDHFSYSTNTPLYLGLTRVDDTLNHRIMLTFSAPFHTVRLEDKTYRLFDKMRPVYAMYREARNATSDFYRFLCFYKILEGLLGSVRAQLRKEAQGKGITLTSPRELVPDHAEIPDVLRQYIGQPIKKFFDDVLTPKFRTAMAHYETDDGTVLHMSDPSHLDQFAQIMLITELCVRMVIDRHESELAQIA